MKLTSYDDTLYPIYDIDLTAPPEIRWKHVAEKESKNIGRLLDDVTKLCGNRVADFPLAVQPVVIALGKPAGTLAGWLVNMVAGMFGQEYVTEIRAIAKHSGQPLSHVMLGNLTYDFCQMAGIVGLGCSSYSCNVAEVPTLVRNMDWIWPKSTGRHTRLIRFHRGPEHYLSVSVLGCVGVLSAMCPGKWAVTMNQAPTAGSSTGLFQWPVLQRLRNVCDQMGSFKQVVTGLQEYQTMTSFFAHVIGTRPTQHAVITGLGDSFRRRSLKEPTASLVQTNHFIGHRDLEEHNSPETWEDANGQAWVCDSQTRARKLTKRLKTLPETLPEARKKICSTAVTTEDTMQQMVFQPANGIAAVWVRR